MQGGGLLVSVLPVLVAGFVFNHLFFPIRFHAQRAEGQKLAFISALSGGIIVFFCFCLRSHAEAALIYWGIPADFLKEIRGAVPVPYALTLLGSIFLAGMIAVLGNFFWYLASIRVRRKSGGISLRQHIGRNFIAKHGNPFVKTMRAAAENEKLIMLTMKSRKVYIGSVLEIPIDSGNLTHIEFLPKASGFRDKDNLSLSMGVTYPVHLIWVLESAISSREKEMAVSRRFSFFLRVFKFYPLRKYEEALALTIKDTKELVEGLKRQMQDSSDARDWVKVVPVTEVESVSLFDEKAHDSWFAGKNKVLSEEEILRV